LFDEILAEIQEFSADKDFEDDVCLVGVEVPFGIDATPPPPKTQS